MLNRTCPLDNNMMQRPTRFVAKLQRVATAALRCSFLATAVSFLPAYAQELLSAHASKTEVGLGEEFVVVVALKLMDNSNQTVCNLAIDFGDGRVEQIRAGAPYGPLTVRHSYKRPGSATIQVAGKMKFQGLNSAVACLGNARTVTLSVLPDDYAARTAAALAERDAALRRAESDRSAAAAAAADARRQVDAARQTADNARAERIATEAAAKRQRDAQMASPPPAAPRGSSTPALPAETKVAPKEPADTRKVVPKAKSSLDL